MNEQQLHPRHPTPAELLLAREEESLPESQRTLAHLAVCAECRERIAELESTERNIADYWRAQSAYAPEPPSLEEFKRRLRADESPNAIPLGWKGRMLAAAALAACLVAAVYLRNPWKPASVEASEVLRQAAAHVQHFNASEGGSRRRTIEIRTGQKVFRRVLYSGAAADPPDPRLAEALALARIDWQDPLNPSDFARWRDEQVNKTDRITRDRGWVRLTTTVLGEGPVRSATITVSQPDWRPLARSVEFRDREPIEVHEVPVPETSPAQAQSAAPRQSEPKEAVREESRLEELELELRLWEAMRSVEADVLDGGQVRGSGANLCYEAWPDGARKDLVAAALSSVPGARRCAASAVPAGRTRVLEPLSGQASSSAPFAEALVARFGDTESADRYLDRVLQQHVNLLARVSALERYLIRFPASRLDAMPAAMQRRVRAIANQHIAAIQEEGAAYLDSIAQGLQAAQGSREGSAPRASRSGGCGTTTARAATSLAEDLKTLKNRFNRLFSDGEHDGPDVSADVLLREAEHAFASLAARLANLCIQAD